MLWANILWGGEWGEWGAGALLGHKPSPKGEARLLLSCMFPASQCNDVGLQIEIGVWIPQKNYLSKPALK